MRIRSVRILRDQVEANDHLVVPHAMAFRSDLTNCFSVSEDKREFYGCLQRLLDDSRVRSQLIGPPSSTIEYDRSTFVSKGTINEARDVTTIHVDLMPVVQQAASLTMENTTIVKKIYEKVRRYISVYVDLGNFPKAREYHVYLDVEESMDLRRIRFKQQSVRSLIGTEEERKELRRDQSDVEANQRPEALENGEPNKRFSHLDYDSVYLGSWSSILLDKQDRRFIEKLHAVLSAKAVIDLGPSSGRDQTETKSIESDTPTISVYLHGVSLLFATDARDASLQDLVISRTENLLILSKKNGLVVRKNGDIITNAMFYDHTCCWQVSEKGFERIAAGDSSHAESGMRFVHTFLSICKPNFVNSELASKEWSALMVSSDRSNPIISLISDLLGLFTVYHKLGNEIVDVKALRQELQRAKVSPEEMAIVFALAGGDLCPPTQHVRMISFVEAVIRYRHLLRGFLYPELCDDVLRFSENHWLNIENVIAAAYVISLQSSTALVDSQKSMFSKLNPSDEEQDWAHEVRRWVAKLKKVDCATRFMPEKAGLQLQARRAIWLLRYWKSASKYGYKGQHCNREVCAADCWHDNAQMEVWGFREDGTPMLEKAEDVVAREKLLRCDYQRRACQGRCNTSRCSCKRHTPPIYCTLCDCSPEKCENRGVLDRSAVLSPAEVIQMEDNIGLENDESSSDDSENDSSSDESVIAGS